MNSKTTPELTTVAKRLVSEGTLFLAVPEAALAEGKVVLLYYLLDQDEELITHLDNLETVAVENKSYPVACTNVTHAEVHFARRLPIFASHNTRFGLPEVPLDKGLNRLSAWLASGRQPRPPVSETAPLYIPIQKLISAGAAAIGLEKELYRWTDGNLLSFRVHMPPATGAAIVDQYDTVVVNGQTYDIEWTFTIDGPHFLNRVPVYADDNILGMEPVPVEDGWANLLEFLRERDEKGHHE